LHTLRSEMPNLNTLLKMFVTIARPLGVQARGVCRRAVHLPNPRPCPRRGNDGLE
jgi:hypothetical protein